MSITTLFLVLLAIVLFPVVLGMAAHCLPLFRSRLAQIIPATYKLSSESFASARTLLSDNGRFTPRQTVAQIAGAFMLFAAGLVFVLSDLQLTLATLGPIFGLEVDGALFGRFDQLVGLAIVLLAVVFALSLTDILTWTYTTPFALIKRGRVGAFFLALLGFLGAVAIGVALAIYRIPILMMDETSAADVSTTWFSAMPAFILVALAVFLLVGAGISFMALDTVACSIVGIGRALLGLVLGALYLVLHGVNLVLEIASSLVRSLKKSTNPFSFGVKAGFAKLSKLTDKVPKQQLDDND